MKQAAQWKKRIDHNSNSVVQKATSSVRNVFQIDECNWCRSTFQVCTLNEFVNEVNLSATLNNGILYYIISDEAGINNVIKFL